jgi:PTS system fructose-specific IIA component
MSDFVKSSQVFLDNPSTTCEEALQFISDQAVELGIATDSAAVLKSFEARESEGSTGMMGGFAIPHAKSDAVKQTSVIVVKFVKGVAWKTLDGTPVRCAIALLVPSDKASDEHLAVLSSIAVELMDGDLRKKVMDAMKAEEIADLVNSGLE